MQPHSSSLDYVIFVHGTGAADVAIRGDKWWQFDSAFERRVARRLKGSAVVVEPFRWSGANLESHRRMAGRSLLQRLRELDAAGVGYHLVGHSHGGSVIWHALHRSVRSGAALNGLRSWTTVGTPFLAFRSVLPTIWQVLLLLVLSAAIFWVAFVRADFAEWWTAARTLFRLQDGWRSPLFLALPAALLAILWLSAALQVLLPLLRAGESALLDRIADRRARSHYGGTWLGLWHPLDEPINGLAATLGQPPQIAPRLAPESWLSLVPAVGWLARIVNGVPARAADEFAWLQFSRRIQGADIASLRLHAVGRAPAALEPGYAQLPERVVQKMQDSADAHAAGAAGRVRAMLEAAFDMQDSDVIFRRIAGAFTFQEIVHTSYFQFDYVEDCVVGHIRRSLKAAQVPAARTAKAMDFPALLPLKTGRSARPPAFLNLSFMRSGVLVGGAAAVATILTTAALDAIIAPRTDSYAINRIAAALDDPAKSSVGARDSAAEVIVRLARLGRIADPEARVEALSDERSIACSRATLARHFGGQGAFSRAAAVIDKLAESLAREGDPARECSTGTDMFSVEAATLAGAPPFKPLGEADRTVFDALLDRVASKLAEGWIAQSATQSRKLAYVMAERGRWDLIDRLRNAEVDPADNAQRLSFCEFMRVAASFSGDRDAGVLPPNNACLGAAAVKPVGLGGDGLDLGGLSTIEKLRAAVERGIAFRDLNLGVDDLVKEVDGLLEGSFRTLPSGSFSNPTIRRQVLARSNTRRHLSRMIVFAAKNDVPELSNKLAASFAARPSDRAKEDGLQSLILSIDAIDPSMSGNAFVKGLFGDTLPGVVRAVFERNINQIGVAMSNTVDTADLIKATMSVLRYAGGEKEWMSLAEDCFRTIEGKNNLDELVKSGLALTIVFEQHPSFKSKKAIISSIMARIRFDERTWSKDNAIQVGHSVEMARYLHKRSEPGSTRLIDDAERGLAFITDADQRSNYTRQIVEFRAETGDLLRARLLAERAFDPDTSMRGFVAILDQIIKAREARRGSGSTGGGW
jgi:hypothetical protein